MSDLDDLYALDPVDFTAARDTLARRRKAAGDAGGAAAVKALRRPTVPAWLLNQLARERPDVVATVIDVAVRMRAAQTDAMSGRGGDALRSLGAERRAVVQRAVREAAAIGSARGRDVGGSQVDAITGTVEAALADEGLAELWRSGRLTTPEQAAGFVFGDVEPSSTPAPVRRSAGVAQPRKSSAEGAAERRQALQERAATTRAAADDAREVVARRRAVWGEADRAAKAARQALRDAERLAAKADLMAATAEQAVWEAGERARVIDVHESAVGVSRR